MSIVQLYATLLPQYSSLDTIYIYMNTSIITLIVFLIGSAFFSAAEVAFLTLSDAKVQSMLKKKLPKSKLVATLKKHPRRLLVTILIGNNIVNIGASSLATVIASDYFESGAVGITVGVMTLVILLVGEIIPKSYASSHPKRFAIFSAQFLWLFQKIVYPFVRMFEVITDLTTGKQTQQRVSEEEIRALVQVSKKQGAIEHEEGLMVERLFAFNDITAEDIMTPRVHSVFVAHNMTIDQATEIIKDNPFTRYPVFKDTQDNVLGFIHARDALIAHYSDTEDNPILGIMRPIISIAGQMPIDDVMKEFQKKQTHMGVVVDEFGGTEGIVTFEDVIEELVGEITDEHDISKNMIQRVTKEKIMVSGDTSLRDINDFFNTEIPGDDLDTIAEVLLDELQKLPRKGQKVTLGEVQCTVCEVKKRRIQRVEMVKRDAS